MRGRAGQPETQICGRLDSQSQSFVISVAAFVGRHRSYRAALSGPHSWKPTRMSTVVPSGTLISVGSRVRALVRLVAARPPLFGTMGSVPRAHGGAD